MVGGLRLCLTFYRSCDRDHLCFFTFAGDTEREGVFLRARIVGVILLMDFARGGRPDKSEEFLLLFPESESAQPWIPVRISSAQSRRPFQLKITLKGDLHFKGSRGFNIDD